jgi:ZIP family zinc transporter
MGADIDSRCPMSTLALYAIVTAGSLLVGAALGSFRKPPQALRGSMLAFGAGALVVAVAFELFVPAHHELGLAKASAGLVIGTSVFIVADLLLQRYAGREATGLALVAAVTLDGVPENFALGVSLVEGGSLALLAAIVASNFPEAFGGAAALRSAGESAARAFGIWGATAALLVLALFAGRLAADVVSATGLATMSALAAGAVLASLADSVMPEAYSEGGPLVAFATSAGFLVAYALTTVD